MFQGSVTVHDGPRMSSPESDVSAKAASRTIVPAKGISRDLIDPSEDSGFSSISAKSDTRVIAKDEVESTIGEGIEFVDPKLIEEEKKLKLEKIKRKDPELLLQKRLAQEAYEQEIQEQQYKRLMHLLTQSKALSNFILKKFDDQPVDKGEKKNQKRKGVANNEDPPPTKRGRRAKNASKKTETKRGKNKHNLRQEDITEELESISDEETVKEGNVTEINFVQPKYFKGELRDYQKLGLNWLKVLYENGLNGILADEMGLGKTIQVIALFAYLMEKHIPGPYMVMVPLSTLPNWLSEFERFAPQLPVVVYYGSTKERMFIRDKISKKVRVAGTYSTYPIVLMTYQMPLFDASFLRQFNWRYIVIDEAQRIKNYECQLFRIVKSYNSVNRLLLTGTPLQNNLTELWSLLNFLLPDIFNNLEVFQSWFDAKQVQNEVGKQKFFKQEQEKQVLSKLREILHPFMLRRLKEDVCPDIPPLKEVMIYTPLTAMQYDLYSAILNRDMARLHKIEKENPILDVDGVRPKRKCTQKVYLKDLNSSSVIQSDKLENTNDEREISMWNKFTNVTEDNVNFLIRLRFGNDVMMYRHVVNHPYIIHYPMDDCGLGKIDENLIKVSGKLLVLDAILKKLKSNGHKILFFSTMTMVLDIIEDYLSMREYQYVRLDGSVKYNDRKNNIDAFQTDPEVFLFLLTTKAGAVGLNLAAADTVIIYDSDWNPQNDLQAMARCHRIGQTKPVAVYRLCSKGTIDEEIIRRANAKRFLEKAVISKEGGLINTDEGLQKLKKLLEENTFTVADSKNEVYTEAELDDLLDRSDMVVSVK